MLVACDCVDPVGLDQLLRKLPPGSHTRSRPSVGVISNATAPRRRSLRHISRIETLDQQHVAHGEVLAPPGSIGPIAALNQ